MGKQENTIAVDQLFGRMARVCSKKEYCVFDIRRKLERMNIPKGILEAVIQQLKEEGFIDEERYITSFINDKLRFNKWGRKKIEFALSQKKLPKEMVNTIFSTYTDDLLLDSLPALLEKKWRSITGKSVFEKEAKLIRYALGRGFAMDEITRCMQEITREPDGDDE